MIIPVRVDVPFYRLPVTNTLILVGMGLGFAWELMALDAGKEDQVTALILDGWGPLGLFGHIWLHGGWMHLLGNALFLWVFGNAVCAKVGNVQYVGIYLLLGLLAGVAHLTFSEGGAIGASGAINGIVGMYLIYYPLNRITCYFMLGIRPIEFDVDSYWMILFWLVFDIWGAFFSGSSNGVGYFAHLGGFAGGVAIAVILLRTGLVTMEDVEKSLLSCLGIPDQRVRTYTETPAAVERRSRRVLRRPQEVAEDDNGDGEWQGIAVPSAPGGGTNEEEEGLDVFATLNREEPAVAKPDFVHFHCECGKSVKAPAKLAGKRGRCPRCGKINDIPLG